MRVAPSSLTARACTGEAQGVAFSSVWAEVYYPAASLYKAATVAFNFGPHFEFPPADVDYRPVCELSAPEPPEAPEAPGPAESAVGGARAGSAAAADDESGMFGDANATLREAQAAAHTDGAAEEGEEGAEDDDVEDILGADE